MRGRSALVILAVGMLIVALSVALGTGAPRLVACGEQVTATTVLPASFGIGARTVVRRSVCPAWTALADRWTVTLEAGGHTDEIFVSHGRPWPGRIEARALGTNRTIMIALEPRSLDGTNGVVEIPIGADGRPAGKRVF